MKRTKAPNEEGISSEERDKRLALEFLRTGSFLIINKTLLKTLGPIQTIFLENLIDKYKYWASRDQLQEDGSFFLTAEQQCEQTGLSKHQIRESKKGLIDAGVLKTELRGIPAKEYYLLDFPRLLGFLTQVMEPNGSKNSNDRDRVFERLSYIKKNRDKDNRLLVDGSDQSDGEPKLTMKDKLASFLPLAKKLAETVQSSKNIKVSQTKLTSWADEIRKLSQVEGVEPARIEKALDWYAEHIGGQYIPVIESGSSLRTKFIKLEDAMKRDSFASAQEDPPEENPKEFIRKHLGGDLSSIFEKRCYLPARELFPNKEKVRGKLAPALVTLYERIQTGQDNHLTKELLRLMPGPITIISDYIEWIRDNDWIRDRSVKLFDYDGTLFERFRRDEAHKDNLERDPITGYSYLGK